MQFQKFRVVDSEVLIHSIRFCRKYVGKEDFFHYRRKNQKQNLDTIYEFEGIKNDINLEKASFCISY